MQVSAEKGRITLRGIVISLALYVWIRKNPVRLTKTYMLICCLHVLFNHYMYYYIVFEEGTASLPNMFFSPIICLEMIAGIETQLFVGEDSKGKMLKYSLNDLDNGLFGVFLTVTIFQLHDSAYSHILVL